MTDPADIRLLAALADQGKVAVHELAAKVGMDPREVAYQCQLLETVSGQDQVPSVRAVTAPTLVYADEPTWERDVSVVLKSVFLCSQAVLPSMIERRGGVIVNITSVNGLSALGNEAYSAAKAGVINLTQGIAVRYGHHGIRCNAIAPGTIRTPIWQERIDRDPVVFERLVKWYPLGRVGEPEDIANAAMFLASDDAGWITGTVLTVDGGLLAGNYRMTRELLTEAKDEKLD